MAKNLDKQRVIELRKLGKSYSQIKAELHVSKSTLSRWLHDYPLSKEKIRLLSDINEKRIEKFRETMKKKRQIRMTSVQKQMEKKWHSLSKKDLEIAGLFLYWGEGNKGIFSSVSLSNTDPDILLFFKLWLTKIYNVSEDKIKIYLHLYQDMNIRREINYWTNTLSISSKQFAKPYIKGSNMSNITHKGFGHGTCNMTVNNIRLKEEIMASLEAVKKIFTLKI
jgi:transcriptional regulator with XRE-family HTH domain